LKIAVYTLTRDRLHDTQRTFALLKEMAGMEYDHYVMDNGSVDGTNKWLAGQGLHYLNLSLDNKGQCISSNMLIDAILNSGISYDYIVRLDNDITPKTDNFLARSIEAQQELGKGCVLSPDIIGLNHKPKSFGNHATVHFKYDFVEALGGACRVTLPSVWDSFRFSIHGPLALGEAQQISVYCHAENLPMVYVKDIVIEHITDNHFRDNPEYFRRRRMEEFVPYGL